MITVQSQQKCRRVVKPSVGENHAALPLLPNGPRSLGDAWKFLVYILLPRPLHYALCSLSMVKRFQSVGDRDGRDSERWWNNWESQKGSSNRLALRGTIFLSIPLVRGQLSGFQPNATHHRYVIGVSHVQLAAPAKQPCLGALGNTPG